MKASTAAPRSILTAAYAWNSTAPLLPQTPDSWHAANWMMPWDSRRQQPPVCKKAGVVATSSTSFGALAQAVGVQPSGRLRGHQRR